MKSFLPFSVFFLYPELFLELDNPIVMASLRYSAAEESEDTLNSFTLTQVVVCVVCVREEKTEEKGQTEKNKKNRNREKKRKKEERKKRFFEKNYQKEKTQGKKTKKKKKNSKKKVQTQVSKNLGKQP